MAMVPEKPGGTGLGKTKGFFNVTDPETSENVGDEPLFYANDQNWGTIPAMDKQTTETTEQTATAATVDISEKMIPESRLNNMIQQITELRKERDTYAKAQAEIEAMKRKPK
jgi:hypothetical protein